MTPEEAIEIIEKQIVNCEAMIDFNENFDPEEDNTKFLKEKEALLMAVKSIKEVQRYREIGTVEECREAVEKQKPMKVKEIHVDEYYCPACGAENMADQGIVEDRYCPYCGQRLDIGG